MRIGVLAHSFITWGGGREFLSSMLQALHGKNQTEKLETYLMIPENQQLPLEEISPTNEWIQKRNYNSNIIKYQHSGTSDIIECLGRVKVDCVLPSMLPLGTDCPYPWVGYLYDFQHKYYPAWFSQQEIEAREAFFGQMLSQAKAIIVNSRAVKSDILRYYPGTSCRVFDLPFTPIPENSWFDEGSDLSEQYNIPEDYFAICNQFWIHKDHGTAFEALAILKQTYHINTAIVCTGTMCDYRWPDYSTRLTKIIEDRGLQQNIYILGHIPKPDQLQIIRKAIAVIQPTLFEGGPGGGSTREAIALGTPVILSDIAVNKEIDDSTAIFFETGSALDLAKKMEQIFRQKRRKRPNQSFLITRGTFCAEIKADRLMEAVSYVREG